ncbi:lasso RiPP family leader peptide-containing protein [Salinibacter ruber]|uniref:lasso RiPP family leader peptide-containing protein n=1 Tax=Salinibacter ruber TaxID=146919 RepID=UPI0035584BE6
MDSYTPPSVTEYGDVSELTKGSGDNLEFDGAYHVCGFLLIDVTGPGDERGGGGSPAH